MIPSYIFLTKKLMAQYLIQPEELSVLPLLRLRGYCKRDYKRLGWGEDREI